MYTPTLPGVSVSGFFYLLALIFLCLRVARVTDLSILTAHVSASLLLAALPAAVALSYIVGQLADHLILILVIHYPTRVGIPI